MSLKWKLAITYLLAVSLTLLLSALLINSLVTSHYLFERRVSLFTQGNIVADLAVRVRQEALTSVFERSGMTAFRFADEQLEREITAEWEKRLLRLSPAIKRIAARLEARAIITDRGQRVLLDTSDEDSLLGEVLLHEEITMALANQNIARQHDLPNGERVYYAVVPAVQQGHAVGAVLLSAPLADLYAQVAVLRTKVITIFAFVGLVVALLSVFVATNITRPLAELTRGAQAIAKGDLEQRVDIRLTDEIGDLAASFNLMAKRLAEEDRLRRSFIADASHELRTPLSSIKALAESLLAAPDPTQAEYRELLADIVGEVDRMNRLVTQLLRLAHLEADAPGHQPQECDLFWLADDVIRRLRNMARQAGVKLELVGDSVTAVIDADLFRQVFYNLGENAIRHTPAGGLVQFSVRQLGELARIEVSDTGPGIPPEQREAIFERFVRLDRSRSRSLGGFGLGLAIVKQIVQLHGGQITVAAQPQAGTVMRVEIPLAGQIETGL
jgi:two-component system OmpR family sensor kinase